MVNGMQQMKRFSDDRMCENMKVLMDHAPMRDIDMVWRVVGKDTPVFFFYRNFHDHEGLGHASSDENEVATRHCDRKVEMSRRPDLLPSLGREYEHHLQRYV